MAAAFEAQFRFRRPGDYPIVVRFPAHYRPVALSGCDTLILSRSSPVRRPYEFGTASVYVSFGAPAYDVAHHAVHHARGDNTIILWNAAHTEAMIGLCASAACFDVRVRKFGDDWLVVDLYMTLVS